MNEWKSGGEPPAGWEEAEGGSDEAIIRLKVGTIISISPFLWLLPHHIPLGPLSMTIWGMNTRELERILP
jgi:hypothetical protein